MLRETHDAARPRPSTEPYSPHYPPPSGGSSFSHWSGESDRHAAGHSVIVRVREVLLADECSRTLQERVARGRPHREPRQGTNRSHSERLANHAGRGVVEDLERRLTLGLREDELLVRRTVRRHVDFVGALVDFQVSALARDVERPKLDDHGLPRVLSQCTHPQRVY